MFACFVNFINDISNVSKEFNSFLLITYSFRTLVDTKDKAWKRLLWYYGHHVQKLLTCQQRFRNRLMSCNIPTKDLSLPSSDIFDKKFTTFKYHS